MKTIKRSTLKPFAFICLGLIISAIAFANVIVLSSPPGRPEAINVYANRCDLQYLAPLDDGGGRVKLYVIEHKVKKLLGYGKWTIDGTTADLYFMIRNNITEGSTAVFRVYAENAAGLSAPSEPSNPVTFEDPFKR